MARKKQRNDVPPGRTSNQGQKLSSGGDAETKHRGNPEIDDVSKSTVSDRNRAEQEDREQQRDSTTRKSTNS